MGRPAADKDKYVAVIDQDLVTDEVRDIAVKYDPVNRSGGEGFHVTEDGELHIDNDKVIEEHKLVAKKCPNDAIKILRLPAERGQLVHQYGRNGFRLYNMPAPVQGNVVGLLGKNGTGKSTAMQVLAGFIKPNLGHSDEASWEEVITAFRGTGIQTVFQQLQSNELSAAYKLQQVEQIPQQYSGTVEELLTANTDHSNRFVDALNLQGVMNRDIQDLSGGELQRVAIAATTQKDVDLYLIDEPSSYLDVSQRLNTARVLRTLAEDAYVLVVEHDLATLDLLADTVHILYGEPGGFGVVSQPLSVKNGVNQFLQGRLDAENLQIRSHELTFTRRQRRDTQPGTAFSYPGMEKTLGDFTLTVEPGTLHEGEVVGVLGPNGIGKTTFATLLAGVHTPDNTELETGADIAYKKQHLDPGDTTVYEYFAAVTDPESQSFKTRLGQPFTIAPLLEHRLTDLSGGELQRVAIAHTLARDADLYLLDEPSAYLDVEMRLTVADKICRFAEKTDATVLVIDHDLLLLHSISDRGIYFTGKPGTQGTATTPRSLPDALNTFLKDLDVTYRKDPETGRPRANKPGSRKDQEQKQSGDYFEP